MSQLLLVDGTSGGELKCSCGLCIFVLPVGVSPVFCIFTRLLLQGLATNRFLFGLELDLSSCEVSIHSLSQTHAHSHVTLYNGDENDADDDEKNMRGEWLGHQQVLQSSSH